MIDPDDPWASLASDLGLNHAAKPESLVSATEPATPVEEPSEKASTGRPRRGRRRVARKEEPATDFDAGIIPAAESDEQLPDDSADDEGGDESALKKRRRRRSRKKKAGVAGSPAESEAALEPSRAKREVDDGEDDLTPIENYASWKIPSWQELIDGLHKP